MKRNTFTKVLCLFLAIVLVLGLCVSGILALIADASAYHLEATDSYRSPFATEAETLVVPVLAADTETPEYQERSVALQTMRDYLSARENSFTVYFKYAGNLTTEAELKAACSAFLTDALAPTAVPTEGDYLKWHISTMDMNYAAEGDESGFDISATYTVIYHDTAAQNEAAGTAVQSLLTTLDLSGKTEYQKVLGIYDWMTNNISYDKTSTGDTKYTAYGAIVKKTCVCQGYALLFYRLALSVGLECRLIDGTSNSQNHGWNIVKVDGIWYNIDSTWDATGHTHNYFLKGSANFTDHVRSADCSTAEFLAAYPTSTTDYVPGVVATVCTRTDAVQGYGTAQEAVNACTAGNLVRLNKDTAEDITVNADLYLDMNGRTLTGNVTVANGATLYAFDSATDDYNAADAGKLVGTVTGNLATAFRAESGVIADKALRYATVSDGNTYSFHRYYADVTATLLQPKTFSVGYKATVVADSVLLAHLDTNEAVGYSVWAEDENSVKTARKTVYAGSKQLTAGSTGNIMTLWVCSMSKADEESLNMDTLNHSVHAKVFINIGGTKVYSDEHSYTLRQQLEQANALIGQNKNAFNATETFALWAICSKYSSGAMKTWDIDNIVDYYNTDDKPDYEFDFSELLK